MTKIELALQVVILGDIATDEMKTKANEIIMKELDKKDT
jgi:hypothetical protein